MGYRKPALIAAFIGATAVPHILFMLQPYFIDESATLLNSIRFVSEKTFVPFHVKYPTFYSYLALPFIAAGLPLDVLFGETDRLRSHLTLLYVLSPLDMAQPARFLSLCLLAVSAVTSYRMISSRKGTPAGLAAASILLVSPALLRYGSYALPDVAVLAFSTLSFAQILKFTDRYPAEGAVTNLLCASAMAGLAISCKYNAVSTVIPIFIAVIALKLQQRLELDRAVRLLSIAALCCVIAFLGGSPGWLVTPLHFAVGLMFELRHAATGHLGASGVPILGYLELLAIEAPVMLLAGVAGVGVWCRRRTTDGWIALAALLGSLALSALSSKQSLHYLYPGIVGWLYFASTLTAAAIGTARILALAVLVASIALLYATCLLRGTSYLAPNTTQLAENWIYRNISPGERIAAEWAYVPYLYSHARFEKLRELFGHNAEPIIEEIARTRKIYDVIDVEYEVTWLTDTDVRYIATSEQVFARFFCTGLFANRMPDTAMPLRQEFDRRKRFYEALFRSDVWHLAQEFETGNGPRTYIFARSPVAESGALVDGSNIGSFVRCG